RRARRASETVELRIITVEHRRTVLLETRKNLRFRVGNRLDTGEKFEMHRLDRGDDGDMRAHEFGERRELARMTHAEVELAQARGLGEPRERKRHAPVIIVGGGR